MKTSEKKLLECYRGLRDDERRTLLEFAEFLASRHEARTPDVSEPEHQPAPDNETVVAAIKRLSATYRMLDRGKMLHEISSLMAQHVMQGREAPDVIAELEDIFARKYADYREDSGQ
ncbi:MAG TPA: Crp/Fnr family transcriptional regulator [Gammaproteobacteria bacterium]|nr:Crp/Fnr family transcriptional regulator [Gammaproteobacteria bacterium]